MLLYTSNLATLSNDLKEASKDLSFNDKIEMSCKINIPLSSVLLYLQGNIRSERLASLILKQAKAKLQTA